MAIWPNHIILECLCAGEYRLPMTRTLLRSASERWAPRGRGATPSWVGSRRTSGGPPGRCRRRAVHSRPPPPPPLAIACPGRQGSTGGRSARTAAALVPANIHPMHSQQTLTVSVLGLVILELSFRGLTALTYLGIDLGDVESGADLHGLSVCMDLVHEGCQVSIYKAAVACHALHSHHQHSLSFSAHHDHPQDPMHTLSMQASTPMSNPHTITMSTEWFLITLSLSLPECHIKVNSESATCASIVAT